jgi:transcriptional regulator with XRE-family HTH domain
MIQMNRNLKALRERKALSLSDLSSLSGVGRVTICRIENGRQKARPGTIRALASALGIEVEQLTSNQGTML